MPRPIDELVATIRSRAAEVASNPAAADKSYTAKLLAAPLEKVGGKVLEEAAELVEAAAEPGDDGRRHMLYEAGDLLYHMLVLLERQGASLDDVEQELARRFGMSGLDEKASRNKPSGT